MDPEYSIQDGLRCHLCEIPGSPMHCAICSKYLSGACENDHLSYLSKEQKVVSFEKRRYNTSVKNIPQKYVNFTVNNVTFLFVQHVLFLKNTMVRNSLIW